MNVKNCNDFSPSELGENIRKQYVFLFKTLLFSATASTQKVLIRRVRGAEIENKIKKLASTSRIPCYTRRFILLFVSATEINTDKFYINASEPINAK